MTELISSNTEYNQRVVIIEIFRGGKMPLRPRRKTTNKREDDKIRRTRFRSSSHEEYIFEDIYSKI